MKATNAEWPDNGVAILVHVPKCGGTSIIDVFKETYGEDACLRDQKRKKGTGEHGPKLEEIEPAELDNARFVAAHRPYGLHRLFSRPALYLTVMRDPVDRFVSDYYFNQDRGSPRFKEIASRLTIDEYFDHKLALGKSGLISNQQTSFVVGESGANFTDAKRMIDSEYFLACGVPQIDTFIMTLGSFLGHELEPRKKNTSGSSTRAGLSPDNERLCRELNAEDEKLYKYVSERFAAVSEELRSAAS